MNCKARRIALTLILSLTPGTIPFAAAHSAHVHGQATLQVTLDGARLVVTVDSALDNLLGFESAPRNDAQRRLANALATRLRQVETVVLPAAEADCKPNSVRLHAPVLAGTAAHDASLPPAGAAATSEHGNMTAIYIFDCAKPQALRVIELKLFEGFPRLLRVSAQLAGPRGQSQQRLTPKRRQITL